MKLLYFNFFDEEFPFRKCKKKNLKYTKLQFIVKHKYLCKRKARDSNEKTKKSLLPVQSKS